MIQDLTKLIEKDYDNICGIIISRNNQTEYEKYFNNFTASDPIHIASVTKSIISILIGIAINKGHIKSVDQKVMDFFPKYQIKRREKTIQNITIKDLLTMTAPYKYRSEPYTKVYSSNDWTHAVLDLLGGKGTIGDFKYTTIGIQVLSGILSNSTGQTVSNFANENLFSPLEIKSPHDLRINSKDEHIAFVKNDFTTGWVTDPVGVNTAGWGLCLSTKDMLKIGQLYLNNGLWDNKQIISHDWIKESTKTHSKFNDLSYGYLWWIIDKESYAAIGDGGNVIYVSPNKNITVVITSKFKPRAKDRIELIKSII